MDIIKFIPHGKRNAVSGKELKHLTGCDERTVKQHIANARLKGAVICSILDGTGAAILSLTVRRRLLSTSEQSNAESRVLRLPLSLLRITYQVLNRR